MAVVIHNTYEVIRELGSGGGGVVYLANHLNLHKKVVLKADRRKITTRPELLRREVDILKELRCISIPQVYDFFVENETVYTAMEYIEGESLDRPLKRGECFSQPQVIIWAKQLLEALDYLHTPQHGDPPKGYVHGDIKPANLMRTPENRVYLIDFNIALALGEEHHIGLSEGYASPEHYGIDFSGFGMDGMMSAVSDSTKGTRTLSRFRRTSTTPDTVLMPQTDEVSLSSEQNAQSLSVSSRKIVPDVRSDIYMVGATLYHLLCGQRPDKDARKITPLSKTQFSPQLVDLIQKSMHPNPELRFQSAREMLDALCALHVRDPRWIRQKRRQRVGNIVFAVFLLTGAASGVIGTARLKQRAEWEGQIAAAKEAMALGNRQKALEIAVKALPDKTSLLTPDALPEAQAVLTEILGVYDLADSYRGEKRIELPSELLGTAISSDGNYAACLYASHIAVVDMQAGEITATYEAVPSALAEAEFINDEILVYAGDKGITCVNVRTGEQQWHGEPATAIAVSADGSTVAAVYRDEARAVVYDASDGSRSCEISFDGRRQPVTTNDRFADPHDALLALNADGTLLAASFADGSVSVFDRASGDCLMTPIEPNEWYCHYEGGFDGKYLVFSASMETARWREDGNIIAWLDAETGKTEGQVCPESCSVWVSDQVCYIRKGDFLAEFSEGELVPLVSGEGQIRRFAGDGVRMAAATQEELFFYEQEGSEMSRMTLEFRPDFLELAEGNALAGSMDSGNVRLMQYTDHPEAETYYYDADYSHLEARIAHDGTSLMLYSYRGFRIYKQDGTLAAEAEIPDADTVADQQFRRENMTSWLEVIYYDGTVRRYDAVTGKEIGVEQGEAPDVELTDTLETESYRIVAPLHGNPVVYSKDSGRELCTLHEDAYLTYATQIGEQLVVQYLTADGSQYGQLLDEKFQVIAELPYLCDIMDGRLIFDYPAGYVRSSEIYSLSQLQKMAKVQEEMISNGK